MVIRESPTTFLPRVGIWPDVFYLFIFFSSLTTFGDVAILSYLMPMSPLRDGPGWPFSSATLPVVGHYRLEQKRVREEKSSGSVGSQTQSWRWGRKGVGVQGQPFVSSDCQVWAKWNKLGGMERMCLLCKAAKHYIDVGVCVSGLLGLPANSLPLGGKEEAMELAGWLAGLLPQPGLLEADP